MEKSNYDRAIADYTQALKLDPNNAGAQKGIERLQDR
jgi:tetratricopeptide (TPR) repeat protein